jgi:hypothetical protein
VALIQSVAAQGKIARINSDLVSFVGAWTLYGFHEDGFTSGIKAAEGLGAKIPFDIVDARKIRGGKVGSGVSDGVIRILLVFLHVVVAFIQDLSGKKMKIV